MIAESPSGRHRPVSLDAHNAVLTAMTAIGGLTPLALPGQGLYAPLAWVIIAGLVTSTLLGRIVTPVLYKLLPPPIERITA